MQGLVRRRPVDSRAAPRGRPRRGRRRRRDPGRQHVLRDPRGGLEVPAGGITRGPLRTRRIRDRLRLESRGRLRRRARQRRRHPANRETPRPSSRATSGRSAASTPQHRLDRVRAFVRIQDGCSFSCAFCVIPLVRGETRSRTADAVLTEVRRRVRQGHREVVLTGVNLGCFRDRDGGTRSRASSARPGRPRAPAPAAVVDRGEPRDDDLVAALTETPTVSPDLHVPLQSGDDGVLKAMGRRYTATQFERRLEPLRDSNLTTDVIVGFPAEDEAAFQRTCALIERLGITRVHVSRTRHDRGPGAADADTVPLDVKRERGRRLRALSDELLAGAGVAPRERPTGACRPAGARLRRTTTRPGSSTARSARS